MKRKRRQLQKAVLADWSEKKRAWTCTAPQEGPYPHDRYWQVHARKDVEQAIICRKKSRDSLAMMEICKKKVYALSGAKISIISKIEIL